MYSQYERAQITGPGPRVVDGLARPVDDRERAQTEKVELDQAGSFDIVFVELRDPTPP